MTKMHKFSISAVFAAAIVSLVPMNVVAAPDANSAEVKAEIAKFGEIENKVFNSWGRIHDGMSFNDIEEVIGPCFADFRTAKDKVMAKIDGTNYAVTMDFEYVVTDLTAKDAGTNGYKESRFIYRIGNYVMIFDCEGNMIAHRRNSNEGGLASVMSE
jgi:hypothetical protein